MDRDGCFLGADPREVERDGRFRRAVSLAALLLSVIAAAPLSEGGWECGPVSDLARVQVERLLTSPALQPIRDSHGLGAVGPQDVTELSDVDGGPACARLHSRLHPEDRAARRRPSFLRTSAGYLVFVERAYRPRVVTPASPGHIRVRSTSVRADVLYVLNERFEVLGILAF